MTVSSRVLDRVEQVVALLLYAFLIHRIWPQMADPTSMLSYLLLISEGAVVLFLLIRKPTEEISMRPRDWLIATAGTFLGLLVANGGTPISVPAAAVLLMIGMLIHIGAKISLNRSFGLVAANRGVKNKGLYRFVRHPMYAGYMIAHVGFLLAHPTLRNLLIYAAVWTLLVMRIMAEERVLRGDPAYAAFAERVRWRLMPGVY